MKVFDEVGRGTTGVFAYAGGVAELLLDSLRFIATLRIRVRETLDQAYLLGVQSWAIVLLTSLFTGMVISLESAGQLASYGVSNLVGGAVAVASARELGPMLSAVVVAGRTGAAIAAELGSMVVTEQIEALQSLGLSPTRMLVVPRLVALVVMLPLLTILAVVVSIVGGMWVANIYAHIPTESFITSARQALPFDDVLKGLFKSLVFAVIIAVIGAYQGLQTRGTAARLQPLIRADDGDDHREHERLEQTLQDVVERQRLARRGDERLGRDVRVDVGDPHPADDRDDDREDGQQRKHHDQRDQPGNDQHPRRREAERLQRFDLFGDDHRTKLGRDGGAGPAGDDDRGEHRPELARARDRDGASDEVAHAVRRQLAGALERDHHAGEQRGQQHDRPRLDAEKVRLIERLADADPQGRDEAKRVEKQLGDASGVGEDTGRTPPDLVEDLRSAVRLNCTRYSRSSSRSTCRSCPCASRSYGSKYRCTAARYARAAASSTSPAASARSMRSWAERIARSVM